MRSAPGPKACGAERAVEPGFTISRAPSNIRLAKSRKVSVMAGILESGGGEHRQRIGRPEGRQGWKPCVILPGMMPTALRTIRFGHSPDADDAFMFYGFHTGQASIPGCLVEHVLEDIQSLNRRALDRADL